MRFNSIPTENEVQCPHCNGEGHYDFLGRDSNCRDCGGTGKRSMPVKEEIWKLIRGRKGLRTARPKDPRAYYVWRMARFHGGVDMTMPIMAGLEVDYDPYVMLLDQWADEAAKEFFGSNMRAAMAWGRAMGGSFR